MYSADYFEVDFRCGRADTNLRRVGVPRRERRAVECSEKYKGAAGCSRSAARRLVVRARGRARLEGDGRRPAADAAAHAKQLGVDVHVGAPGRRSRPRAGSISCTWAMLEHRVRLPRHGRARRGAARAGRHFYLRGPITTTTLARQFALQLYATSAAASRCGSRAPPVGSSRPRRCAPAMKQVGLKVVEMRESKIAPAAPAAASAGSSARSPRSTGSTCRSPAPSTPGATAW